MNKRYFHFSVWIAVILVLGLISCKKKTMTPFSPEISKDYFPLEFGKYVVYDVDSVLWDDFHQVKTIHKYQMRYTVADTFTDDAKNVCYRIDIHIRKSDTLQWQTHKVVTVTTTDEKYVYAEGNVRYIKMVFPVVDQLEWKGNSLIPAGDQDFQYLQDWTYKYVNTGEPFNDGKAFFDNTVTVLQADESQNDPEAMPDAYAYKTYSKEVYGHQIGMVYREMTHWTYDPSPGHPKYRSGYSVVMRAVDHN